MQIVRKVEFIFAFWFTLEILLRLCFAPNKFEYGKSIWNWFDFLAVVPLYLLLVIQTSSNLIMVLNMLRYMRIFRLFKLLYDLQILAKTLQASLNQLFTLVLILCVPAIIFSSIVYYTEQNWGGTEKEKFKDIPNVIWWSIITMTTIGYGDMTPNSFPGKIVGVMSTVVGIVVLSMTASILGTSFQQYYILAITQLKIPPKKPTAVKIGINVSLINHLTSREEIFSKKSSSIKSSDSKDSGYGRSPLLLNDCPENYRIDKSCQYEKMV